MSGSSVKKGGSLNVIEPSKPMNRSRAVIVRCIVYLAALGFCVLADVRSAFAEDVLHVRDGSTVRGTIIEIEKGRTVKIRSSQGKVFIYMMADIRRMEIDPQSEMTIIRKDPPPEEDTVTIVSVPHKKWSVDFGGGMAMPVGAFGATSGTDAGLGGMGWMVVVDGSRNLLPSLDVVTSGVAAFNKIDISLLEAQGYHIKMSSSPWISLWALTGLKAYTEVEAGTEFYGMGQAGVFFGISPRIDGTPGTASPGTFGFGVAAGGRTRGVDLSIRYLHAVAEYETIKIPAKTASLITHQEESFIVKIIGMKPGHSFYRQSIGCMMFTCAFYF